MPAARTGRGRALAETEAVTRRCPLGIAIDDFGVDSPASPYLPRLPVDVVQTREKFIGASMATFKLGTANEQITRGNDRRASKPVSPSLQSWSKPPAKPPAQLRLRL